MKEMYCPWHKGAIEEIDVLIKRDGQSEYKEFRCKKCGGLLKKIDINYGFVDLEPADDTEFRVDDEFERGFNGMGEDDYGS